ncbi:ABC transporter ATP-binding protein [Paraclostridium bifermentans]|nr:ABC transporter ATP-binding protein [Paraclostridium bifermentans]
MKYILKHKLVFFVLILFSILDSIILAILPYISGKLIDNLLAAPKMKTIYIFALVYIVITIIQLISQYLQTVSQTRLTAHASMALNCDVINHMQKLPLSFFGDKDMVYYNQRIYSDSSAVISFAVSTVVQFMSNILSTVLTLYIVAKINTKICIFFFIAILVYTIQYVFTKKILYSSTQQFKERQAEFYSILFEQMSNLRLIKVLNAFEFFKSRLDTSFLKLYKTIIKSQKVMYTFKGSQLLLTSIARVFLLIFAGIQFLNGKITIGMLSVLLSYLSTVINSATYFVELGKNYVTNLVSYNRLKELEDIEEEPNGEKNLDVIENISLTDIHYGYDNNKLVKNLNIKFDKGKIYCIYGPNGIGKSTLADLVLGLHHNYSGKVLINDQFILNELDMYKMREKLCYYASQHPLLFNDTIYNNIMVNISNIDKADIEMMADKLGLFSRKDSNLSFEYIINENGTNLSGGECQKISLIRSFLSKRDVIIYDEPTSYLDTASKKFFVDKIHELKNFNESIIIIITHDETLKQICDKFINLEEYKV